MPYLPHTRPDHDETLIARLAVDDLASDDRDRLRATTQVAECPACAELLADLRTIATAVAALPEPRRTRDFRVTEADAARLRPTGWRGARGASRVAELRLHPTPGRRAGDARASPGC